MKQQINLYLPELRRRKDWLDLKGMAVVTGGFIGLLALASLGQWWSLSSMRDTLEARRATLDETVARTQELEERIGDQSGDQALVARTTELKEALAARNALLEFLEDRALGNAAGFSTYLVQLGRHHLEGLSLTRIELREGGDSVTLAGRVLRGENVPLYLQNLSGASAYAGKNFEAVRIGEAEDAADGRDILRFEVDSTGTEAQP